jgi:hypothetical protein
VPVKTKATYYPANSNTPVPLPLYAEYARGVNAYGVFLGGDFPLMRVVSDVKNGKKIAVIKDSYGNAFVPYLAAHYEEVFILDYRYFVGNIKTLLEDNGIQNLLFAHNTYVVLGTTTALTAQGATAAANTFVTNETVKDSMIKFIDAQADYTKKATKVGMDTFTTLTTEMVKASQDAMKFDYTKFGDGIMKAYSNTSKK